MMSLKVETKRQGLLLFMFVLLISSIAFANEGGHGGAAHHEAGIPRTVWFQFLNFGALVAIIFFASKNKVRDFFRQREQDYTRQAREAAERKQKLQNQKADLDRRFLELVMRREVSLKTAAEDAEKMVQREKQKTQEEVQRIHRDVQETLRIEEQKQMEKLRQEALDMSMVSAENDLKSLDANEKQKINGQFTQRLEGAVL